MNRYTYTTVDDGLNGISSYLTLTRHLAADVVDVEWHQCLLIGGFWVVVCHPKTDVLIKILNAGGITNSDGILN